MIKRLPGLPGRISRLREMAALSAREVDQLAGLRGTCHTRAIETGVKARISGNTLAALARVFGVSMDWLFRGDGPAPDPGRVRVSVGRARRRLAGAEPKKDKVA